jgi:hypothetical protein
MVHDRVLHMRVAEVVDHVLVHRLMLYVVQALVCVFVDGVVHEMVHVLVVHGLVPVMVPEMVVHGVVH